MRYLRVSIDTGFIGAQHEDEVPLPDDWDEMTERERDDFMDECAIEFRDNRIDCYAEIVEG